MLSSLKKADGSDAAVLRIYEAEGKGRTEATIELPWDIAHAEHCDLLERTERSQASRRNTPTVSGRLLRVNLAPWEVATIRVALR
jgi:alpha-mannosidase